MKREFGLDQVQFDPTSVVTVGTFDGVHRGHQAIVRYLCARAAKREGSSVVVTFSPHPREVVRGEPVPLLTTIEERAEIMEQMRLDRLIVIPFTPAFAKLSAEAFVEEVLVGAIGLREIVVGYDHGFGRGRSGDRALLEQLGAKHDFSVDLIPAQVVEEHVVSSSEIRRLLTEEGNVALAAQMLGRPYSITGRVTHGDGRGRSIGFPTANIEVDHGRKVIPMSGVYAVRVWLPSEESHRSGMMNIGVRPTFGGREERLEVHILDYEGDLYGQVLRLEFVERLRSERTFSGVEALRAQLESDREHCKAALAPVS